MAIYREGEHNTAHKLLAEEAVAERLSVFVGAGCSVSAGIRGWRSLLEAVCDEYDVAIGRRDVFQLAGKLERKLGVLKFRESIISEVEKAEDTFTTLHTALFSLPITTYVTTNYDHMLESAFRAKGIDPKIIKSSDDLPSISKGRKTIVKLHGDIDSPSSLVISRKDYREYKVKNVGFIEWLNAEMSRNTLLFVGTSFDDPRLREIDDHIISLMHEMKRQHFIILKQPLKSDFDSIEQFEIEVEEFDDLCHEFSDRLINIVVISEYSDVDSFLKELHQAIVAKRSGLEPENTVFNVFAQQYQTEQLEATLQELVDEKTSDLCDRVRGSGRLPTSISLKKDLDALVQHLIDSSDKLKPEAIAEGWIRVVDSYILLGDEESRGKVGAAYCKAQKAVESITSNEGSWKDRLERLLAKVFQTEGRLDEAIELLSASKSSKSKGAFLTSLLIAERFDEIIAFLEEHGVEDEWLVVALYAYVAIDQAGKAELLFNDVQERVKKLSDKELKDSFFENRYFLEKWYFCTADAFFQGAMKLAGLVSKVRVLPSSLDESTKKLLRKSNEYLEELFKSFPLSGSCSYFSEVGLRLKLSVNILLGNYEDVDQAVASLVSLKALDESVVDCFILRTSYSEQRDESTYHRSESAREIVDILQRDYSEYMWACLSVAKLMMWSLEDYDQAASLLSDLAKKVTNIQDRIQVVQLALDLSGFSESDLDIASLISLLLPETNPWYKYLNICLKIRSNGISCFENELLSIAGAKDTIEYPVIRAQIFEKLGIFYGDEKNLWEMANNYFSQADSLTPNNLSILNNLLRAKCNLQRNDEAFELIGKIEELGFCDRRLLDLKAIVASNLGRYDVAEDCYRQLLKVENHPQLAIRLAQVLRMKNQLDAAIEVLSPFALDTDSVSLDCLGSVAELYSLKGEPGKAFDVLDRQFERILDVPELLVFHMTAGFKAGKDSDQSCHKSMARLDELYKQGKVSESLMTKKSIEDVKNMALDRDASGSELLSKYLSAQTPRVMLSGFHNRSLYIDWKLRTRPIDCRQLDRELKGHFATYSTNGVILTMENNSRRVVPVADLFQELSDGKLIVDYHSLITLQQLDLLREVESLFGKIYYPEELFQNLLIEQEQFKFHQPSREKTLREINKRLSDHTQESIVVLALAEDSNVEGRSLQERAVSLAKFHDYFLISFNSISDVCPQYEKSQDMRDLLFYMYNLGALSREMYDELVARCSSSTIEPERSIISAFDDAMYFVFTFTAIEFACENQLIVPLMTLGKRIVLERSTAQYIQNNILAFQDLSELGVTHKKLIDYLDSSKSCVPFKTPELDLDVHEKWHGYSGIRQTFSCIKMVDTIDGYLLTDDRFTQLTVFKLLHERAFGTDTLLSLLHRQNLISTKKYADSFLKLCKWRYRFLLPPQSVLKRFADEFKEHPPGIALEEIAQYGHDCFCDPGLIRIIYDGNSRYAAGLVYQMKWVEAWCHFLCDVWRDVSFSSNAKKRYANLVFKEFLPLEQPSHLSDSEKAKLLARLYDLVFLGTLTYAAESIETCDLLGLIQELRTFLRLSDDDFEAKVRDCLESLGHGLADNEAKQWLALGICELAYGKPERETVVVPVGLVKTLTSLGLNVVSDGLSKREVGKRESDSIVSQKNEDLTMSPFLENSLVNKEQLPDYAPGPARIKHVSSKNVKEIHLAHEAIKSENKSVREAVLSELLNGSFLSPHSKHIIEKKYANDVFVHTSLCVVISSI